MKKFISVLTILFFAVTAVSAADYSYKKKKNGGGADKANVKFGPIKFKSTEGAVAASLGNVTQIALGGNKGQSAGYFTLFLEASEKAQLEKGTTFDVVTTNQDADNDNAVTIIFQGTRTKGKGLGTKIIGVSSDSSSEVVAGTFKVVSYDETTGKLKFVLKAKVEGYTLSKAGISGGQSNSSVNKKLPIAIKGVITLP